MSEFDQLMKAIQQQDAKLNKLLQALPEIVDFARLLRDLINATGPPKIDRGKHIIDGDKRKIDGGKRKRGRPPKEKGKDNSDSRSFETRLAKAREMNASRQRRVVVAALDQYIKSLKGGRAARRRRDRRV